MPTLLRGVAAILIALLAAASPCLAATAPLNPVAASIDDLFFRLTAHGFSGSVLIVQHGKTLLRKGYGLADQKTGAPVEPETALASGDNVNFTFDVERSHLFDAGDGRRLN